MLWKICGYLHIRPGTGQKSINCITEGKHDQDISNSLHLFSTWIIKIANSDNISLKNKALSLIVSTLQILEEKYETTNTIITPSFFTIQTIF